MKKIILLLFFLFIAVDFYSQSITAGVHNTTDYYYDVNPDTTIFNNCRDPNPGPGYYDIDINNDSIIDFVLKASSCYFLGGGSGSIQLLAKNKNQISYGYEDSCFSTIPSGFYFSARMALKYKVNELVDSSAKWLDTDSVLTLSHGGSSPAPVYYSCAGSIFTDTLSIYLGVRIFVAKDTLYGWVKIKHNFSVILEEYACNLPQTGIKENPLKRNLKIYPNPVSEELHIEVPNQNKEMELLIYNSASMLVMKKTVAPNADEIIVPAKVLAAGFYYFTISENSKTNFKGKFIISQ